MQNNKSLYTIIIKEEIQEQKETAQKKEFGGDGCKNGHWQHHFVKRHIKGKKPQANYRLDKDKQ